VTDGPSRARVARTVVVALLLALALMWIYVLFVASPASEDKLQSNAFPIAAQPVCQSTLDGLKRSGLVNQVAPTPQARAALVDAADGQLGAMVQTLRTLVPPSGDDASAVRKWLDDWDQWLRDRATWSGHLHRGEDAPFLEKQRDDGAPYSKALDAFATTNNMQACTTPVGV
jgi:hypothetical protein